MQPINQLQTLKEPPSPPKLTKRERRRIRKEEREKERQKLQKTVRTKNVFSKILWVIIPIIIIIVVILVILKQIKPIGITVANQGNDHIASVNTPHEPYISKPPTSGAHVGDIALWGIHDEEIPDELQIHNLEDGGVMVQYNPKKVSPQEIEQLKMIMEKFKNKDVILAPYSKMEYKIALTAWTHLLPLELVDETAITAFIKRYEGIDHHVR